MERPATSFLSILGYVLEVSLHTGFSLFVIIVLASTARRNRPKMSQELVNLLRGLANPNTTIRAQAEKSYQEARSNNPAALIEGLAGTLSINDAALQQLSAVLLRRCLEDESEASGWNALTPDRRRKLRQDVLTTIPSAQGRLTRKGITHVIAQLSKLCLSGQNNAQAEWPELFRVMFETSQSPDPERRESGFEMFAAVAEYAPRAVAPHSLVIGEVLGRGLKDVDSVDVRLASLKALGSLMVSLDISDLTPFRPAVPVMLDTLKGALDQAASTNDERLERVSQDAIKALIDIVSEHPKFLRPDFESLAQSMIAIASAEGLDATTRSLGLEFLVAASVSMPSFLRKEHPNLASELVPLSMRLMCEKSNINPDMAVWENNLDAEAEDDDDDALYSAAEMSVHRLASALGGKTVLPKVLSLVPALLSSADDWRRRRVAIQTLALVAEGCGKRMYSKLSDVMKWAAATEKDVHPKVRHAVVHLLGRLCLDFGDDEKCGEGKPTFQKKYTGQTLPMLSNFLRDPSARVSSHAASALVNFFTEFGDLQGADVAPFLDGLLEGLMALITNGAVTAKDESLAAVSAIATISGPELFARYYDHLMPLALGVATNGGLGASERISSLKGRALECAGLMAAAVGKEKFAPHATVTLTLVLQGCHQKDDSTLRNNAVAASVRVAKALDDDFLRFLPELLPDLVAGCKEDFNLELIDDDQADEMEARGFQVLQFHVRGEGTKTVMVNSMAVQGISSCIFALYNFALQFKHKFAPYAPEVFGAVLPLLDADALQAVRNIAVVSLPHIVTCVAQNPSVASDLFMVSVFSCLAKIKVEEEEVDGEQDENDIANSMETQVHLAESLVALIQDCYASGGAKDNDPYLGKRIQQFPPAYGFATPSRFQEGIQGCAEALQRRIEILIELRAQFEEEKADHDEGSYEKFLEMDSKHYEIAERLVDACGYLIKMCSANPAVGLSIVREHVMSLAMTLTLDEAKDDIKRLGLCLLDDYLEFMPHAPEDAPLRARCLKICLETCRGDSNAMARASVWGLGLFAVYGGAEADAFVMECVRALAETVETKSARMGRIAGETEDDNDERFELGLVVDNALSALEKFCRHRGAVMSKSGLAPNDVLLRVVQHLPCSCDSEEAKVINVQMAKYAGTPVLSKEEYVHLLVSQLAYGYDSANVCWDETEAFIDETSRLDLARAFARGEHQMPQKLNSQEMGMLAELGRWFAKKESGR